MKAQEFRDMTAEEIERKIKELKENLFKLRIKHNTKQLEKTAQLSRIKKDIAKGLTVLSEKKKEAAVNGS
ncbi:MAG TPA: 50S ribosomal protein L29 [Firmicutes bacterium]|nr:50S ribosomal protein L29 [Bacillota bacterium]